MNHFTPISSLLGGVLIGLSTSILLVFNGRLAGVSGIFGGLLIQKPGDVAWRAFFLAGVLASSLATALIYPAAFPREAARSLPVLAVAGFLVGFGTRLGNGCTSGHGVCGLSRLSARSSIATLVFISSGMATAILTNHVFGGLR